MFHIFVPPYCVDNFQDLQLFSDFNMFGDLKTPAGVKALNSFLADHSYIEGWVEKISVACRLLLQPFVNRYVPSQADTQVYEALGSAPKDAHALRWFVEFDIINLKLLESKSTKHR